MEDEAFCSAVEISPPCIHFLVQRTPLGFAAKLWTRCFLYYIIIFIESVFTLLKISPEIYGPVAHLVERLPCTEEVAGSSPVRSTTSHFSSASRRMHLLSI